MTKIALEKRYEKTLPNIYKQKYQQFLQTCIQEELFTQIHHNQGNKHTTFKQNRNKILSESDLNKKKSIFYNKIQNYKSLSYKIQNSENPNDSNVN